MVKNLPAVQETWFWSLGWEDPLGKEWQPTPVFLSGEFYGQRSLMGYSLWSGKESDTTEWLTLSLSLKCLGFPGSSEGKESTCNVGDLGLIHGLGRSPGERHGNPLQYSCLENPHGQRSLAAYSPWGGKESDTTEWLSTQWEMSH